MKFTRLAAVLRTKTENIGAPGDHPGICISKCMSQYKLPAMNSDHCFCLNVGDVELMETFSEGADVLTVLEVTQHMPKSYG